MDLFMCFSKYEQCVIKKLHWSFELSLLWNGVLSKISFKGATQNPLVYYRKINSSQIIKLQADQL